MPTKENIDAPYRTSFKDKCLYRVKAKSLSHQQGQLTLVSIPGTVPRCRFTMRGSFAMHHFAAPVVEKRTVRALLLRGGLSTSFRYARCVSV